MPGKVSLFRRLESNAALCAASAADTCDKAVDATEFLSRIASSHSICGQLAARNSHLGLSGALLRVGKMMGARKVPEQYLAPWNA
jgi:hypothetical protein